MAEILRINESAPAPVTPALPHNIEAEAALLGALMIDNRLVEDVQTRLKPHHFFEPLHGRIYEAILRLTDRNMIANPVTLRPLFEADEGIKEVGGPSYLAQLTGSGAAIIGAVKVGSGCAIGANAVVSHDLCGNAVAVGVPARVISLEGSAGYVDFCDYSDA